MVLYRMNEDGLILVGYFGLWFIAWVLWRLVGNWLKCA